MDAPQIPPWGEYGRLVLTQLKEVKGKLDEVSDNFKHLDTRIALMEADAARQGKTAGKLWGIASGVAVGIFLFILDKLAGK
jgi:tetrahydromethanopterin S-methyltransferase subunit G